VNYYKGNIPLEIPVLDKIAEFIIDNYNNDNANSENAVKESPAINEEPAKSEKVFVGNTRNHKLHSIYCDSLPYEENRIYFSTIDEAYEAGYTDKHYECMGD